MVTRRSKNRNRNEHARAWSRWATVSVCALLVTVVAIVFGRGYLSRGGNDRDVALIVAPPIAKFTDVTTDAGIDYVHSSGATGQKYLPETMGGGCAFFDFDNDGDEDILFVSTAPVDPKSVEQGRSSLQLFKNDGTGEFDNITSASGLDMQLSAMGASIGDYDSDGYVDIYITCVGTNRLLKNEGNGKFTDVTSLARVGGDAGVWSTSSGWFDYDRDGDLDLFVCNYLSWSAELDREKNFRFQDGTRAYGRPQSFQGTVPYLFRNDGHGSFDEVAASAGLHVVEPGTAVPVAKSLGVTFADFDYDGHLDIVVANDTVRNFLFVNTRDGKFREVGQLAGIAYDEKGAARGAMGIDTANFRNDDSFGIAIGNFSKEMTAVFVSRGKELLFSDEARRNGIGASTHGDLSFGLFYFDYDLDGRQDLFIANGHLERDIDRAQIGENYEQSPQLFWNTGHRKSTEFVAVPSANCGHDLRRPLVGRGAAYADIDADGDIDVLITSLDGQPRLLRNDQQLGNNWIRFRLTDDEGAVSQIGARIDLHVDGQTLSRQVMPTRSYLSQVESAITFGLGACERVNHISVVWPDGTTQQIKENLAAGSEYIIRKHGKPVASQRYAKTTLAKSDMSSSGNDQGSIKRFFIRSFSAE